MGGWYRVQSIAQLPGSSDDEHESSVARTGRMHTLRLRYGRSNYASARKAPARTRRRTARSRDDRSVVADATGLGHRHSDFSDLERVGRPRRIKYHGTHRTRALDHWSPPSSSTTHGPTPRNLAATHRVCWERNKTNANPCPRTPDLPRYESADGRSRVPSRSRSYFPVSWRTGSTPRAAQLHETMTATRSQSEHGSVWPSSEACSWI